MNHFVLGDKNSFSGCCNCFLLFFTYHQCVDEIGTRPLVG
jgi:hypothetical protein